MTLLLISIVFILPVVAIASYQHYKIGKQPAYDAKETLLNYEIIGSGENKLVLLHIALLETQFRKYYNYA